MSNGATKRENYLREYAFIFFAQKKMILLVTLIVFACSAAVAFFWPPVWGAAGSVLVTGRSDKAISTLEEPKTLLERTRKEDLYSEATILTSNDVLLRAVEKLNRSKSFASRKLSTHSIQSHLNAEIVPSSNVIDLLLTWNDPEDAEVILGAVMDTYLQFRNGVFNPPQREEIFDSRSKDYLHDIEDKQLGVMEAIKTRKAPNPELEIRHNLEIKQDYTRKLQSFREELTDKEYLIEQIASDLEADGIRFFSYIDINPITVLNSQLQELTIERNAIAQRYGPKSEKSRKINAEVAATSGLIRTEAASYQRKLKDQVAALRKKISMLDSEIDTIDQRNLALKSLDLQLKNIDRESDLYSYSFDTFAKRKEEADFLNTAGRFASDVSVIANAHALDSPVFPKKEVLLPLGLGAGLLLGFSLGFIREFTDYRFKRPEDVERQLQLPVIMSIPDLGGPGAPSRSARKAGERRTERSRGPAKESVEAKGKPIGANNKFSTLLGWTSKDDLPPNDKG